MHIERLVSLMVAASVAGCGGENPTGAGGSGPASSSTTGGSSDSGGTAGSGGAGTGGTTGSGSTTASGSGGTAGSGGTTGSGGTGGTSAGCVPGTTQTCYSGPPATSGVGVCKAGVETCNAQGTAYGPCVGEVVPAPENCATDSDDDCDGAGGVTCLSGLWSKRFGDAAYQAAHSVAAGPAGEAYVAGRCTGSVDFGGGPLPTPANAYDWCVAKLDANGGHLWSRTFSTLGGPDDRGPFLAVDGAGNLLLTASFGVSIDTGAGVLQSTGQHEILVAKYSAAGVPLWSKRFGDPNDQISSAIGVDGSGNVVIAGSFKGTVDFGGGTLTSAGNSDAFVAKLDAAGNHLWSKRFGGPAYQEASSLAVGAAGNVVVVGSFAGTTDFGGGTFDAGGTTDFFAVALAADGAHLWSKDFGDDAKGDSSIRVALGPSNEVMLAGTLRGSIDFGGGPLVTSGIEFDAFAAALDASGNHLWSKRFGDASRQTVGGVTTDAAGNVTIAGSLSGTADFGGGAITGAPGGSLFLARFDAAGNPVWSQRFGAGAGAGAVAGAGSVLLVAGSLSGSLDLGTGVMTSQGSADIFVAKMAP